MSKERKLLAELVAFLADKPLITSDVASIQDMFERYANPPFTMHFRAAMRMTITDTTRLQTLLRQAQELLTNGNTRNDENVMELEQIADDH